MSARLFKVIGLTIALLLACYTIGPDQSVHGQQRTRILVDMMGNKIEVADPVTRVALLGGPTGQIAYILGARDQLCAVTNTLKMSELVLQMDPSIKNLPAPRSTAGQINIEELILSDPQLVITGDLDGSIVQKKTRIPVALLKSTMNQSFDLLKEEIRFYGNAFGRQKRAEKYVKYLERNIERIRSRTRDIPVEKRKKVLNGYSSSHLVTLGGDTFMQQHLELAGCRNAAEEILTSGTREGGLHTGLAEVSMEKVLEWNPDIVVIDFGSPSDLKSDSRWSTIKAIRDGMVFRQPMGVFIWDRPTAESAILHPLWLAKIAYPERFEDIDMVRETKDFYREIMSFELTDEQANAILSAKYSFNFMNGKTKPGR